MTKSISFIFLTFLITSTTFANEWLNVKALGAMNDGSKICTNIIQSAIDKASENGGGVIYFPPGTYLTGALHLKSNITLHLDAGSLIRFSDDPDDYLPFVKVRWEGVLMKSFSPLLHANQVDNITIEGRGTFDGQGKVWWETMYKHMIEVREKGDIQEPDKYQKMWQDANQSIKVSDYYQRTLKLKFFRPPFFQAYKSSNIRITGVKFINSPFWTINPAFCDNITIDGITINNPPSPNTDGINPSSCSNVRIANCHISVGDDCITIKSGRDAEARELNVPCQNITITNCTMLSGHGGVVIGSEMSGGVKKVSISNCVFDGTDRGIRLKASRERGGTVEEIRVSNVVMKDIQKEAFMFNLHYDKNLPNEGINEKTPRFRNIHISNVTGTEVKQACRIIGLPEMPIQNISFSDINIDSRLGFNISEAKNIEFHNVTITAEEGSAFEVIKSEDMVFENVKTNKPLSGVPVIKAKNISNTGIYNCFLLEKTDLFLDISGDSTRQVYLWGNEFSNVKTPVKNAAPEESVIIR